MESLSEFLKTEREKKGIRLEEIASITKIHLHALQHLEKGNWKELPPEPFIRGFIVAYSKYVGLNAKDILERYRAEVGEKKGAIVLPATSGPQSYPRNANVAQTIDRAFTFPIKKIAVGAGAVVGVVVLIVLISLGRSSETETSPTMTQTKPETPAQVAATDAADRDVSSQKPEPVKDPVKEPTKPEPAKVETKAEPVAETKAPEKPAAEAVATEEFPHNLSIEGKDRTWVKVVIDDAPPIQYFLQAAGKAEYKAKNKIKLVLGIAPGATVKYNGEVNEGRKLAGTIRAYIFPKDSKFPQDQPVKRETTTETPAEEKPDAEKANND